MHVWTTTYALTIGIQKKEVVAGKNASDVFYYPGTSSVHLIQKPNWHETEEGAVVRAEKMRKEKIASLHEQIARLEALEFRIQ